MLYRAQQLVEFQEFLIRSVNTEEYPEPLLSRSRTRFPKGANRADHVKIEVDVKYGSVPLDWKDLTRASVKALAVYYTNKEQDSNKQIEWKWLTGIFLNQFGAKTESREMLMDVARQNPKYRDALEIIY